MKQDSFIIGKRITVGAAIGGVLSFAYEIWNLSHPDQQISVGAATGLTTFAVAMAQLVVVNWIGVTTGVESDISES